ncbi:formate/nitrite transporter, partial [Staphylococcus aureus]
MKKKHIKWNKSQHGDDWINNVVQTIKTKDILQSVYLKHYLLRAMKAGFIIGNITGCVSSVKATRDPHSPPGIVNMA